MNRFAFTDATIKELYRYIKKLYDTFESAHRTLLENPTRSINTDFHLDYVFTPEKYYYYMDADSQIEIIKYKYNKNSEDINDNLNFVYTLQMYGISTELPHCDSIPKGVELYNHCYGNFKDIDTAISVFKSIIVRINSNYCGNEYTKLTSFYREERMKKLKETKQ